jgi:voltage-gated potassium channel
VKLCKNVADSVTRGEPIFELHAESYSQLQAALEYSDADNVYITLSAREKNPKILIYARGDSDAGLRRLKLAGADQVVAAYQWAGMRIALGSSYRDSARILY